MKVKKALIGAILATILLTTAQAIKVGVVVTFPNGETHTECVYVAENANGYEVMQNTGLNIAWNDHPLWRHGMCGINDVGCPADNCWCSSEYWGFHISTTGSGIWKYSPVGFDAGDNCWNGDWNSWDGHYCTKNGQMLGFAYGSYGTKPEKVSFNDVCPETGPPGYGGEGLYNITMEITKQIHRNSPIEITLTDKKRDRTVKKAQVIVYDNIGGTARLYTGKTDENGYITFSIDKTGKYSLEVRARDYHNLQETIEILHPTTTTTTSTTTSSTTTSTSTPSTTMLPHVLYKPKTTIPDTGISSSLRDSSTTTKLTTTTLEENKITGRAVQIEDKTGDYKPLLGLIFMAGLFLTYLISRK